MSFKFNWDSFTNDDNFYDRVTTLLTDALNKGKNPSILADTIRVRELYLGDESPQLEILEVGDLADDRFRGIFKLTYNGNASITLATKIRANPLQVYAMSAPEFSLPQFKGSSQASLSIPLNLTLSDIKLSGIIILVFSKAKGLTLVFRNDPLESIRVTSTFDTLPGIARFLQTQIEKQIRSLFREDLPAILHKLSHRWTPSGSLMLEKQRLQQELEEKQAAAAAAALASNTSTNSNPDININENHIPPPQNNTMLQPSSVFPPGYSQDDLDDCNKDTSESVSFVDINPDQPVFSPENMKKLHSLYTSQLTLSLSAPTIPEAAYRTNLCLFDKSNSVIQNLQGDTDLNEIARIQSRNYFKSSHTKPKRRVIKVNRNSKSTETKEEEATTQQKTTRASMSPLPTSSVVQQKEVENLSTQASSVQPKEPNVASLNKPTPAFSQSKNTSVLPASHTTSAMASQTSLPKKQLHNEGFTNIQSMTFNDQNVSLLAKNFASHHINSNTNDCASVPDTSDMPLKPKKRLSAKHNTNIQKVLNMAANKNSNKGSLKGFNNADRRVDDSVEYPPPPAYVA